MLHTSGCLVVDDIFFFYNGPYGVVTLPRKHRCNDGLKPLLRGIGCVL